ncbi:unnamed protein product [Diamesa tonsa]
MFLVGLTGGIACGKSSVAEVFVKNDIPFINADHISRQIVEPGTTASKKIRAAFGDEVFQDDGTLNREKLGKIIFDDVEKRRTLNQITHPIIHRTIYKEVFRYFLMGENFVVVELPLLFELNVMRDFIHKVICVTCEEDIQLSRLMDRNNLTLSEAKKRVSSQMPLEEKCNKSNWVIENSGSQKDMEEQTLKIINMLLDSNHHWKIRGVFMGITSIILAAVGWYMNRKYKFIAN